MHWIHKTLLICACSFSLISQATELPADLGPVAIQDKDSGLDPLWHKKGVFIEIFVRAYQDSNKDGKGDLNGVIQRLDYLKSLGVSGIWLMPIFQSKAHDHGYDVINYRDIEKHYGTLNDFERLTEEAHKRGIGVIVDYVMNHSASSHPLFDLSETKSSPYHNWYIWSETYPEGWSTFSGDPWHKGNGGWYYGVFVDSMPDFNLKNPEVVNWHLDNLKFWLNRGADGFRFDATGVLVENSIAGWENQPENHQLMHKVRELLNQYSKRHMVCEAPGDPAAFAADNSCGSAFAFGLQKHIVSSVKFGRVANDMLYSLNNFPMKNMATILANHDAFAGSRLFKQFNGNEAEYKLAAATLMTLPGTPYIYYGEEIGLSLSPEQNYEDQEIRGPMSWTSDPVSAGFTTYKKPFRLLVENSTTHNVEAQEQKPDSLLNTYRQLIKLRTQEPALSMGTFKSLEANTTFTYLRELENSTVLVISNYAEKSKKYQIRVPQGESQWATLYGSNQALYKTDKNGKISLPLQGLQTIILKQVK